MGRVWGGRGGNLLFFPNSNPAVFVVGKFKKNYSLNKPNLINSTQVQVSIICHSRWQKCTLDGIGGNFVNF